MFVDKDGDQHKREGESKRVREFGVFTGGQDGWHAMKREEAGGRRVHIEGRLYYSLYQFLEPSRGKMHFFSPLKSEPCKNGGT